MILTAKDHPREVYPCLVREVDTETNPKWALVVGYPLGRYYYYYYFYRGGPGPIGRPDSAQIARYMWTFKKPKEDEKNMELDIKGWALGIKTDSSRTPPRPRWPPPPLPP